MSYNLSKKKRKLKLTLILAIILIILIIVYIIFSHSFPDWLTIALLLSILYLSISIPLFWLKIDFDSGISKLISAAKLLPFALIAIFLSNGLKEKYEEYLLRENRVLTYGVVEKTYSHFNQRQWTTSYIAEIRCLISEKWVTKKSFMNSLNQFKIGDTVIVEYSETAPEIFNIQKK